jgi:hypothetical protein
MKTLTIVSAALVALAAGAPYSANADSSEAMCGDTKRGASGPCTFSQRQGYIDLDLRNGDSHRLAPGNNAGHYMDQKGNKVMRTHSGDAEQFKWEGGTKIIVTLAATSSAQQPAQATYRAGDTAPDLADLVGAKAGQAEGELERRGYSYATGSTSGNTKYSSWFNRSTGRCVMIRTEEGRYQSIVQTSPTDCAR